MERRNLLGSAVAFVFQRFARFREWYCLSRPSAGWWEDVGVVISDQPLSTGK
ncbi:hypothetical protein Plim_0152 [Planctopirus limnophila DSM 3776]|uniref:Uncharacterized protein n=1 Tax=Planctopirus limnophila (strain ATCC 43296 / DSM 3776 / IFAM 1008 / Mu 290) TaxID=521674 RepID=D5SN77_PLAL2|nr:hypothetical protein Plim_0152 [Planctopirus limnophila DSM 3776]